ncbi:hypothetical protein N665_0001s0151 [Sinapis alba]|nr:hypothetical protein N665_0001s0151 [Sinapis alba]
MVKGGTKRKATMEKITKRESLATTFTKRSYGLHSKVSQLCLLTGAQIAVLATPPSANSNVSFFSFGHSSVDSIVNAFLTGERPVREERDDHDHEDLGICLARKELGLPQWWEDDRLLKSKDPQELTRAINSMSRLLTKVNELRAEDAAEPPMKKKKTEPTEQTLVLRSGSSFNNTSEEEHGKALDYNNNNVIMTEEELDQIMSTCLPHNNNNNNDSLEIDFDQLIDLDFGFDLDTTSVFVDDSLLESAMNCVASADGFMETNSIQEQLTNTTTQETNSSGLNSVSCDDRYDASILSEEDTNFSDYLTQFLQF